MAGRIASVNNELIDLEWMQPQYIRCMDQETACCVMHDGDVFGVEKIFDADWNELDDWSDAVVAIVGHHDAGWVLVDIGSIEEC